jgi:ABC-2 type transport system permease protein
VSIRRIRGIARKELRELRRIPSIVVSMAVVPLLFCVQPFVAVFALSSSSAGDLRHEDVLLYLLGIPALVPVLVASYAVVGERQQGTLEPMLSTPVRRSELLLAKALAALLPSVLAAYGVYAVFIAVVEAFVDPAVASALLQWRQILAQVVFTPLIAAWSIWVAMAISTRTSDIRVAQQLGVLASLPAVIITTLIALGAIPASFGLALTAGIVLLLLDGLGWRVVAYAFNRERLITGTR